MKFTESCATHPVHPMNVEDTRVVLYQFNQEVNFKVDYVLRNKVPLTMFITAKNDRIGSVAMAFISWDATFPNSNDRNMAVCQSTRIELLQRNSQ